jgi:hypothetical protein
MPVTEAGRVVTPGDIREAIELSDAIPTPRKKYLCWALTHTIALIGKALPTSGPTPKPCCVSSTSCRRPRPG